MASKPILLLALIFLAATSQSRGLIINGVTIARIVIPGRVFCTVGGNPAPNAAGVVGAIVTLRCGVNQTTLAYAVTDPSGAFQVVFSTLDVLVFDPSSCAIFVNLPVANCGVLPPTGNLRATINLVNVVTTAIGGVANFATGLFSRCCAN